jgi:hypothetical protein
MTQPLPVPSPTEVARVHTNSDVDSSVNAQHHTLGIQHTQGSPGSHNHDGKNSKKIGKGLDLAFPTTANGTYSQTQIQSIIDALRDLGFGT